MPFPEALDGASLDWLATAALAISSVEVTVNGRPVVLAPDGSFEVLLARGADVVEIVARDGAGAATGIRLGAP